MLAHVRAFWLMLGFTFCMGLSFSALSSQEEEAAYRGALCLIRGDHKLVMTQEVLTGKLSLPGGTIEAGETPKWRLSVKHGKRLAWWFLLDA